MIYLQKKHELRANMRYNTNNQRKEGVYMDNQTVGH